MSIEAHPDADQVPVVNKSVDSSIAGQLAAQAGCDGAAATSAGECSIVKPVTIVQLTGLLRRALLPQLLPQKKDQSGQAMCSTSRIAILLDEVEVLLRETIKRALSTAGTSTRRSPEELASAFMSRMPVIQRSLKTDIQAAYDGDPACKGIAEVILCYPGVLAVTVHRIAHELFKMEIPLIPRMMAEWAHSETGIDIHPGATIGDHFFIDHGTGVVIGETCEIGRYVKIYQGVTLGALSFAKDENGDLVRDTKRHPTIEDNVVIYANATVLGGRTVVGHDSVIGSSVWLTYSVDPMTTVVMERPKLKLRSDVVTEFDPPLDFQI
ncbi:MAG: serine O-acetyltransferase EpsC [Planctomycetota bacterium]